MTKLPTARDLIAKIIPNQANFEHCGKHRTINGSLLLDIERAIESHTQAHTKELREENATIEKYNSLLIEEKRILRERVKELEATLSINQYTIEDMRKSFYAGHSLCDDEWRNKTKLTGFDEFIDNLK